MIIQFLQMSVGFISGLASNIFSNFLQTLLIITLPLLHKASYITKPLK